jgi:sugar lactone lactonase YvrE
MRPRTPRAGSGPAPLGGTPESRSVRTTATAPICGAGRSTTAISSPTGRRSAPDRRLFYTVETAGHRGRPQGVYVSRITLDGTLEAQRPLIDWHAYDSAPDGVVTDGDGNLWLGEFRGNVLRCFSPDGEQLASVPLPAWSVNKAAFGGARGDLLCVTSARIEADEETLARYPDTGGVIEVSGTGARAAAPNAAA